MDIQEDPWVVVVQAPRESYKSGKDPISRDMIHGCGERVQVIVDEWGQMWEWCANCKQESAVTQQRPKGYRRHDQRERLMAEIKQAVDTSHKPADPRFGQKKGGLLPLNTKKAFHDDL